VQQQHNIQPASELRKYISKYNTSLFEEGFSKLWFKDVKHDEYYSLAASVKSAI
jgi:hypothetical protein